MPTYDYKCEKCGHGFEIFEQMSSRPIKKCPKCGGRAKRLFGSGLGFKRSVKPGPSCGVSSSG